MTDTDIMDTSMDTSIDDDPQMDKIERIKSRMVEKRKKAAKLASMNGSWNKSFGKKRRCPNASVVLKASLKSNNRALAKSLQTLKQENRMAQDMIIELQNEQQVLIQKVYQQRQTEKEDMRIRKEIQTALGDVTTNLLMAGNRLAYAMEMTTKVPIRESLLRSSSVQAMSSDDDSICLKQRQSSLGPSVYYRNPMSTGGPAPVSPVNEERPASRKSTNLLPKSPLASVPPQPVDAAAVPMETDREMLASEQDPDDECLDPSMMKDLYFDIPMMFTDDDVTGKIEVAQSDDEDGHSIKRRTRSSRTSGFVNLASASSSKSTSKGCSSSRMEPVKSTSVNSQNRVTFVIDQQIREDQESSEEKISSVTEEKEEEQPSSVLNQTFEIEEKPAEKSNSNEKSIPGEKTSQNSSKESNDESPTVDETCPVEKAKEASTKKSDSNITKKKKSKLPLKKAKTKVNLKKKDMQETFQSPKSPLMSPGVTKSSNGFSFRCVPSPVFDRPSKRQPVPSKPVGRNTHDTSLSSVFDLSEGETFTEAKSVLLPPEHETILECSDKIDSPLDKDETNKATDLVNMVESQPAGRVKSSKTKVVKKKGKVPKDEKIAKSAPSKDQVDEIGDEEEADARKEDKRKPKEDAPVVAKTKTSKKSSKSAASSRREDAKTQKELNDEGDGNNEKKQGKKKSAYFPFEEEEGNAASSFFITKPMIHKKKKDDKKNDSKNDESGREANEDNPNLSLLSDFMLDISSALNSVQKMNQNLKQDKGKGKRKKKRSSIPIFTQNKSIMASRLDAAMVPLENTLENTQDITKQPEQENNKMDGESEVNQQELSSTDCQINKAEQCNDKVEKHCEIDEQENEGESIPGQSETTKQGTRSRRSRLSSAIQPTKGRKRRRDIESEDDSEEAYQQEVDDDDSDYKPITKSKKSAVATKRKTCRVSFNVVEDIDEASESDTGRQRHKKPRKDNHKKASKTKTQDSVIVDEKKAVKADKPNKVRSTKVKTENEENEEDKVAEKRHLKNCIKKRSSVGEKKTTQGDSTTGAENDKVDAEVDQKRSLGGRRTSRRAASAVNYKEPSCGSKLRRGDAHTSNDYLKDNDIYKGPADVKKGVKKIGEKNRKPLSNVQNTIVKEEISCESSD